MLEKHTASDHPRGTHFRQPEPLVPAEVKSILTSGCMLIIAPASERTMSASPSPTAQSDNHPTTLPHVARVKTCDAFGALHPPVRGVRCIRGLLTCVKAL
jgi:hypothetical protein